MSTEKDVVLVPVPLDRGAEPSTLYRNVMRKKSDLLLPNAPESQEVIREAVNTAVSAGDTYYTESLITKRALALLVSTLGKTETGDPHAPVTQHAIVLDLDVYRKATSDDHGFEMFLVIDEVNGKATFHVTRHHDE